MQPSDRALHPVAVGERENRFTVQGFPQRLVPPADVDGFGDQGRTQLRGPVQPGRQIVEARRDVLDQDVDVELALPVGQLRMHLAGLGVDEPRLQHLPVAGEQGVGQRAVAPEDAVAVQLDEQ